MQTPFNPRAIYDKDVRHVLSGKDCALHDEDGTLLSTADTFQAQVTFNNANYQPIGSPLQASFLTGYSISITLTNCVVESDRFVKEALDFFTHGRHAPSWNLKSTLNGYDGSEEVIVFRSCIPTGNWDVHNLSIGDIIKRSVQLACNQAPELQSLLSYSE